jgi:predicted Zn-dependent peptidase
VQKIGGTFSSSASEEYAVSSMTVLARHIEKGAGLFADAVRRPRFDSDDWSRVQRLSIDGIRQALEVPSYSSAIVADRILLGDANPYGWSVSGTASTVESLTLEQVKSVHGAVVRPDSSTLIVLGDIEASAARALAEKLFADWQVAAKPAAINRSFAIPAPAAPGMRLAIVNRPGATQTFIRFAAPGVTFGSADRTALRLLNTILGGSFTSRLNQNLRENKGYTYGARSAFAMDVSAGTFQAYASVQAAVTGPSLLEFFKEFDRLTATGDITDAEVVKARETVRNDAIRGFQSLSGIAETAAELDANNLDFRAVSGDLSSIENISASDLNATAKRIIRLDKGVLVLVGDKALILEQIKGMKLPPAAEYDAEGNPVEGT